VWSGPLTSSSPELARLWAAPTVSAGVNVSEDSALGVSAFFAAVSTISWDVASLPLFLYKRLPTGGKARFDTHPLYRVLHDAPNPEQTSFQFRAATMCNVLCTGSAFAEIVRDGMGRPRQLWHIDPARVAVVREDGELRYRITQPSGGIVMIDARNMIHLRGPSPDGVKGYDMVSVAREALGLAIASERFGGKYFSNGAQLGGILATNGTELARKNLAAAVDAQHQGVDRAHKWFLAPEGSTFTPVGVNPRDSQMTELREHEVREIARFFKIPVAMIGDLSRATWSNFEQQQLQYYTQCIRPWLINLEQEFAIKLINSLEQTQQCVEHAVEGFLRADVEKRGAFYSQMVNIGAYSINEVREFENMPPIAGGDQHRVPMNTEALAAGRSTPIHVHTNQATGTRSVKFIRNADGSVESASIEDERDMAASRAANTLSAHRDLLLDVTARWIWKLCERAQKHAQPSKLRLFAQTELRDRVFAATFLDMARPAIRAWLATQDRTAETDTICESVARHHVETYFPTLLAIADNYTGDDFERALQQQIALWRDNGRLHGVIDHLIQHGAPPPVNALALPSRSSVSLGTNVKFLGLVNRQKLVESNTPPYKSPIDKKRDELAAAINNGGSR
jgi:HK97 family phage portal protein